MGSKKIYLLMLFGSTLLGAIGQLLFKFGLNTPASLLLWIGLGLLAYILSTVFYFMVLSRVNLSWAFGMGGLSYVFAALFAYFILSEGIPVLRWIGVGVIFIGVLLIGLS
jgi:uncharacterized membrane protein